MGQGETQKQEPPLRCAGGSGSQEPEPISGTALDELTHEVLSPSRDSRPTFPGYTIIEEIGKGSFGTVYRARDEKLDREVALKTLSTPRPDPAGLARFVGEARVLARLKHPAVITIHTVVEDGGRAALVMELIRGQSLDAILEAQGPFGAAEATAIGVELCRALSAVHAAGLVHRDVKTANVLREEGGRIVLTDFGLGAVLAQERPVAEDARIAGSPLFMAPEQLAGAPPAPAMDIYSLGALLFHLVTERFPVSARSLAELAEKVQRGALTPLRELRPDLPADFVQAVTKALARNPRDRYAGAGEMEAALLACRGHHKPAPRRPGRLPLVALAVVLPLAIAATFAVLRESPRRLQIRALALRGGQPLGNNERVQVGDGISLELESNLPVHVYAVNEDSRGEVNVLFPLRDVVQGNPLPAGRVHHLPGKVGENAVEWEVSSAGGTETICILASTEPIPAIEKAIASNSLTGEVVLRGIGRLKPALPVPTPPSHHPIAQTVEELVRGGSTNEEDAGGIWARKITFRNP